MKILLSAAATAMALTALAGSAATTTASRHRHGPADTSTPPPRRTTQEDTTRATTARTYPDFAAADYTFVLEPSWATARSPGRTKVTVEDGEATSAVVLKGGEGGMKKGSDAPRLPAPRRSTT